MPFLLHRELRFAAWALGDALFWRSGVGLCLTQAQRIPEFTRGSSI
jgi:hypothetical protein